VAWEQGRPWPSIDKGSKMKGGREREWKGDVDNLVFRYTHRYNI